MDGFCLNLQLRCVLLLATNDSILVLIRIIIWIQVSFFKDSLNTRYLKVEVETRHKELVTLWRASLSEWFSSFEKEERGGEYVTLSFTNREKEKATSLLP